jgi:hypothetical protein
VHACGEDGWIVGLLVENEGLKMGKEGREARKGGKKDVLRGIAS